jgi:hypothetical protein
MMQLADFIAPSRRIIAERARTFIARHGGLSHCVAPAGVSCPPASLLKAHYGDQLFEGWAYATTLSLPSEDSLLSLHSHLTATLYLLCLLAEQPDWLERLRASDPRADDEAIVRSWGIDPAATCRPSVAGWAAGEFLAPDTGGYAYFLVEPQGQVSIISRSESVLPVAFHLAANREMERTNLTGRLGQTDPTPDHHG